MNWSPELIEKAAGGILLCAVFIAVAVLTGMLMYHWDRFGFGTAAIGIMKLLHFIVILSLGTVALLLYLLFIATL